ncbi:MAG: 4Fe-4S binding protein [Sulfuricella sp.]|nr:4Fe-4S binding protein [Sulfuricella sp.]
MEHAIIPILSLSETRRKASSRLQRFGDALRRHRGVIIGLQWAVVVFYLALMLIPAFLPLPPADGKMLENLTLFAQFIFWGIWWPFVILSVMAVGRAWCGLFCPEGSLTELASRHGLGLAVPRWIKWSGWPFVAFVNVTIYGQLVSVYEYPKPVALILGGTTLIAILVGLIYGKGTRVWCRHLCPVSGVFGLLARLAPVQFKVDRQHWDAAQETHHGHVNCAPLIDMRRMTSAAQCHMCGRCSGHRDAVTLTARLPGREIVEMRVTDARPWEARLLVFGILGVAVGAFQWSASPWFVTVKTAIAAWLIDRDWFWLLQDDAPWWLLTHYPNSSDVFTRLDGLLILAYIGAATVLVGGWVWLWLRAAGAILPGKTADNARWLTYSLIPLGGCGIFLGLSALTISQLSAEGLQFDWLPSARGVLLGIAALWSMALAAGMLRRETSATCRIGANLAVAGAVAGVITPWWFLFFGW